MFNPPSFAPLAHALRDELIDHYEREGTPLATPAGLRTLDTNSVLASERGRPLLRLLALGGAGTIAGQRVLDLGAGFGSLAVYFAHLGARVVAVDPNSQRLEIASSVARAHGLSLETAAAHGSSLPLDEASFDVVVANNSLCYVVPRAERRATLAEMLRVLRPGGWLVMRNPNRLRLRDPFTGLPFLAFLPRGAARWLSDLAGRQRSDVRLLTPWGAARELRRSGYSDTRWCHSGARARSALASYHHVVARRPEV